MNLPNSSVSEKFWLVKLLFLVLTFVVTVTPCFGQVSATLSGTVSDATGASVPGAGVTATNSGTGVSSKVTTDASGRYVFLSLAPGVYSISVQKAGFQSKTIAGIQLLVDQKATLDVQVHVGELTTTVQVQGQIALVQINTASLSTVIGTTQATDLPLNLRRYGALALLVPGTVTTLDRGGAAGSFNPFASGSAYSANGSRTSGNNTVVDGVMNRALTGGGFAVQPTPDSVQEFRIQTNVYDAAYGLSSGSVITLVTKTGTNEIHGSVYEFLRNEVFDARNFFAASRGKFVRNQFGFSLGGPIKKDKTFFFGNFEPLLQRKGTVATATIPTAAQKAGDLNSALTGTTANLCGAGGPANLNFDTGQLFDPATLSFFTCPAGSASAGSSILVGSPIPGNIIKNIDPVAQKVLATLYNVVPNRPGIPNFVNNQSNSEDDYILEMRGDHNFRPSDSIFARYLYGRSDLKTFSALPNQGTTGYFRSHSAVLGWTHTFSPTLVHDARVGFQRNYWVANCLGCPLPAGTIASFGVQNLVGIGPSEEAYPQFNFLPSSSRNVPGAFSVFTTAGDRTYVPAINPDMMETYQYHLGWNHGKHTTHLGADMSFWQSFHAGPPFAPQGTFFFDGRFSSLAGGSTSAGISPIADFLLGYPESVQRTFRFTWMNQRGGGFWNYFVQDDFAIRPNLTLNLGLRYDYRRPATDKRGSYMSFLQTGLPFAGPGNALLLTSLPDAANDALCTDPQYAYLTTADGRCLVATTAIRNKLGFTGRRQQTIIAPQHALFAPRFGLSWRPLKSDRLVIHTGAGMFYDLPALNNQHFEQNNPVFGPSQIYSTTFGAPPPLTNGQPTQTETVFTGANAAIPRPSQQFIAAFLAPDYKVPAIAEWSFGIESQLASDTALEITYVGNHAYHLGNLLNLGNQPRPGIGAIQPRRPFPDFAGTLYVESNSNSSYNALQVKVTKRLSHGFMLLSSYAWSKTLNDNEGDEGFGAGNGQAGPQDENNLAANKGPGATDVRHRFITNGIWRLPFGKGHHFLAGRGGVVDRLVGGWSISSVFTAQSGFPLTVTSQRDWSNTSSPTPRPDRLCKGTGARTISSFLDATCFSTAALQAAFQSGNPRFGNSGRGILEGPRYINLDLALLKDTAITERVNLQFRAEAYNSLNRAQFSDPNLSLGNPAFGKITSVRADPRDVQFGLKLLF